MAYKDRVTSMCSYGTNRKLSTALALIGNPSILLLVRNGVLLREEEQVLGLAGELGQSHKTSSGTA